MQVETKTKNNNNNKNKNKGGGGGGVERNLRNSVYSHFDSAQIPNNITTKKKDTSKQHSKQAKTGELERNYKMHMFADPVFINPSRSIFRFMFTLREIWILPVNLTI